MQKLCGINDCTLTGDDLLHFFERTNRYDDTFRNVDGAHNVGNHGEYRGSEVVTRSVHK